MGALTRQGARFSKSESVEPARHNALGSGYGTIACEIPPMQHTWMRVPDFRVLVCPNCCRALGNQAAFDALRELWTARGNPRARDLRLVGPMPKGMY